MVYILPVKWNAEVYVDLNNTIYNGITIKNGTLLLLDIWDYLIDISFIIYVGGHVKETWIIIFLAIYGIEHQHQHVHKIQS